MRKLKYLSVTDIQANETLTIKKKYISKSETPKFIPLKCKKKERKKIATPKLKYINNIKCSFN